MQTYSVEILNPKAIKLLNDLVDLQLISLKKEIKKEKNRTELQKLLLKGPTWTDEEYKEYLENRESINKIGAR
jgi:hypothetical protein